MGLLGDNCTHQGQEVPSGGRWGRVVGSEKAVMRTQRRKGAGGCKLRRLAGRAQRPWRPGGSDAEVREQSQGI